MGVGGGGGWTYQHGMLGIMTTLSYSRKLGVERREKYLRKLVMLDSDNWEYN